MACGGNRVAVDPGLTNILVGRDQMAMARVAASEDDRAHLFRECARLTGAVVLRGEAFDLDCPYCGKPAKRGQVHFRVSQTYGAKCWVCGQGESLRRYHERLAGKTPAPAPALPRPVVAAKPEPPPPAWTSRPEAIVEAAAAHPYALAFWQSYKPVSAETCRRYQLGVGRLPSCACPHDRLIYPVREGGEIAAIYGRRLLCKCAKVLVARGSRKTLFGIDDLIPYYPAVIVENPVDAMLINQASTDPEWGVQALAIGSAGIWRDEWGATLSAFGVPSVLLWLDNDLAGYCTGATRRQLVSEWRQANPTTRQLPRMHGPVTAGRIERAGVPCTLYEWPAELPPRCDPGLVLAAEVRERQHLNGERRVD